MGRSTTDAASKSSGPRALRSGTVWVALALVVGLPVTAAAQIFHAPTSANLPTATVPPPRSLLIEISHRFTPAVSTGAETLWGLDGPVVNRLGLGYTVTQRMMVGLTRSNLDDNLELTARRRTYGSPDGTFATGVAAGVAWNTSPPVVPGVHDNESQFYVQAILDVALGRSAALGLVPTYLRNPRIRDASADDAVALGIHGRVALGRNTNVIAEWIASRERPDMEHDSGSFGIDLRTRGHVFTLVLTNQVKMNPSQVLGGSAVPFRPDAWRLGFNLTRRIVW